MAERIPHSRRGFLGSIRNALAYFLPVMRPPLALVLPKVDDHLPEMVDLAPLVFKAQVGGALRAARPRPLGKFMRRVYHAGPCVNRRKVMADREARLYERLAAAA